MSIKKNDFVEIDYTGSLKDDGIVFDTTNVAVAKENGLHAHEPHGAVTICIGQGQIVKGIEEELIGKESQISFELDIAPEKGFGKKNAKLIAMIPSSKFREQKIQPYPGLQLNIDNMVGVVKTMNGGRIMVDFNHPLAGKTLHYSVTIKRILSDKKEKLNAALSTLFGLKNPTIEQQGEKTIVKVPKKIPEQAEKLLSQKLEELTHIKNITFEEDKSLSTPSEVPHVHGPQCSH